MNHANFVSVHEQLLALAAELGSILKARNYKLALAESCTGGMATQYTTAIAGSSAWLDRSFITYSNAAKIEMLLVRPATLTKFGAVSEQTACEMAKGALANSEANITASITGIAGPDGGSVEKPVGTVCFAICANFTNTSPHTLSKTQYLLGNREEIRMQSVKFIFEQLLISISTTV